MKRLTKIGTVTFIVLLCLLPVTGCQWGTAQLSVSHIDQDGTEYRLAWTSERNNDRDSFRR